MSAPRSSATVSNPFDPIKARLQAYYQTKHYVPKPPLATEEQLINGINLSIITIPKKRFISANISSWPSDASLSERKAILKQAEVAYQIQEQTIAVEKLFERITVKENKEDRVIAAPKRLLIQGQAGVGKSTMSQYFAYRWGKGDLWQNRFDYVFWIPIRTIRDTYRDSTTLAELIYLECLNKKNDDADEEEKTDLLKNIKALLANTQSRILFLLDGYDEGAHLDVDGKLLKKLIKKALCYHVIMTSRPYGLTHDYEFDVQLENKGFTDQQIEQYVKNYFSEIDSGAHSEVKEKSQDNIRSQALIHYLKQESNLWGMMHVPLNAALVCGVYQMKITQGQILKAQMTLTELYQEIVEQLSRRYLQGFQLDKIVTQNCSREDIEHACQLERKALAYCAFESLQSKYPAKINPDLFQSEDMQALSDQYQACLGKPKNIISAINVLGLLRNLGHPQWESIKNPHEFIHFTFQEYFAACYIVQQLQENDKKIKLFLERHRFNRFYMLVFQFVAGLLNAKKTYLEAQDYFWKALYFPADDLVDVYQPILLGSCFCQTFNPFPYRSDLLGYLKKCIPEIIEDDMVHAFIPKSKEIIALRQAWQDIFINCNHPEIIEYLESCVLSLLENHYSLMGLFGRSRIETLDASLFKLVSQKNTIVAAVKQIFLQERNNFFGAHPLEPVLPIISENQTDEVLQYILELIESNEAHIRSRAIGLLSRCAKTRVAEKFFPLLEKLLCDKEDWIKQQALCALIEYAEAGLAERVLSCLLSYLQQSVEKACSYVVDALTQCAVAGLAREVYPHLFILATNQKTPLPISAKAIIALGKCVNPGLVEKIVPILFNLLSHKSDFIRSSASRALGEWSNNGYSRQIISQLINWLQEKQQAKQRKITIIQTLGECAYGAIPADNIPAELFSLLTGNNDEEIKSCAAVTLSRYAEGQENLILPKLFLLIKDKDREVRSKVTRPIKKSSRLSGIFSRLFLLLEDEDQKFRDRVSQALIQILHREISEKTLQPFLDLINYKVAKLRNFSAQVIGFFVENCNIDINLILQHLYPQLQKQTDENDEDKFLVILSATSPRIVRYLLEYIVAHPTNIVSSALANIMSGCNIEVLKPFIQSLVGIFPEVIGEFAIIKTWVLTPDYLWAGNTQITLNLTAEQNLKLVEIAMQYWEESKTPRLIDYLKPNVEPEHARSSSSSVAASSLGALADQDICTDMLPSAAASSEPHLSETQKKQISVSVPAHAHVEQLNAHLIGMYQDNRRYYQYPYPTTEQQHSSLISSQAQGVFNMASPRNIVNSSAASSSNSQSSASISKSFHALDQLLKQWAIQWAKERNSGVEWLAFSDAQLNGHLKEKSRSVAKTPSKVFNGIRQLTVEQIGKAEVEEKPLVAEHEVSIFDDKYIGVENTSNQAKEHTVSLKNTYTSGWELTESTTKSLEALVLIEASFPGVSKIQGSLKAILTGNKSHKESLGKASETVIPFPLTLQAGTKNTIQVKRIEKPVEKTVKVKIAISGALVICCKKKVTLAPQKKEEHYKWVIPVREVIKGIQQYQLDHQGFDLSADKIIFIQEETATNIKSTETEAKIIETESLPQHLTSVAASSNYSASSLASVSHKPKLSMTSVAQGATVNTADIHMALASQPNMTFSEGASLEDIQKLQQLSRAQGNSAVAMLGNFSEVNMQVVAPGANVVNLKLKEEAIRGGDITMQPRGRFLSAQRASASQASNHASAASAASAADGMDDGQEPSFHEKEEFQARPM